MMKRKLLSGIIGGFIGFVVGVIGGGFLGLVVGGTFLGGLEIYKNTGFEGYELAAYVGAIIGAIIVTLLGVKLTLRIASKKEKKM
jgi:CDP-diglyceride synthetase